MDFFLLLPLAALGMLLPGVPLDARFFMLPVPVAGGAATTASAAGGSSPAALAAREASGSSPVAMIGRLLERARLGDGGNCMCDLTLPGRAAEDALDTVAAAAAAALLLLLLEVADLRERLVGFVEVLLEDK